MAYILRFYNQDNKEKRNKELKKSDTIVGSGESLHNEKGYICIRKEGVKPKHCQLSLNNGKVVLKKIDPEGETWINENKLTEQTRTLSVGDKIEFGTKSFYTILHYKIDENTKTSKDLSEVSEKEDINSRKALTKSSGKEMKVNGNSESVNETSHTAEESTIVEDSKDIEENSDNKEKKKKKN